jgi:sensor histidine kinase YesM
VTVTIRAAIEDGQLCITVKNDKVTDDPRIRAGGTGVGLLNVRRRLQAVYGEAASLTTERTPEGYIATICIPGVKARS